MIDGGVVTLRHFEVTFLRKVQELLEHIEGGAGGIGTPGSFPGFLAESRQGFAFEVVPERPSGRQRLAGIEALEE